jgi:hypothetical protein
MSVRSSGPRSGMRSAMWLLMTKAIWSCVRTAAFGLPELPDVKMYQHGWPQVIAASGSWWPRWSSMRPAMDRCGSRSTGSSEIVQVGTPISDVGGGPIADPSTARSGRTTSTRGSSSVGVSLEFVGVMTAPSRHVANMTVR